MSARRGFALPIIIIAILIPVIILAVWAPWVTPNFAYKRIEASVIPPCEEFKPNLSSQLLGKAPSPYHKFIFGTEYFILVDCPSSDIPNGNDYFVSFLGTTHKLSSTPNSSWGIRSSAVNSNETTNWKTFTNKEAQFSFKYPKEWMGIKDYPQAGPKDTNQWLVTFNKKPFEEYKSGEKVGVTVNISKNNPTDQTYMNEYKNILEKKINIPFNVIQEGEGHQQFSYTRLPDISVDGFVGLIKQGTVKNADSLVWADVYLKKDADYLHFYMDDLPEQFESSLKIFKSMLSTFKFE